MTPVIPSPLFPRDRSSLAPGSPLVARRLPLRGRSVPHRIVEFVEPLYAAVKIHHKTAHLDVPEPFQGLAVGFLAVGAGDDVPELLGDRVVVAREGVRAPLAAVPVDLGLEPERLVAVVPALG